MSRRLFFATLACLSLTCGAAAFGLDGGRVLADVGGVFANVPTFQPGQPVTITVTAEDDDGALVIKSNLSGSTLTVTNCTGIGANQVAGKCDGTGLTAVTGQGTTSISIDSAALDNDATSEPLTVTLTLVASCTVSTSVTVSADQPGNVGPDDVTINCAPSTPTPSPTPTLTPSPTATLTPLPSATPIPATAVPPAPTRVLTSETLGVRPPSTGNAGLK
jgi:hypothetical protein